MRNRLFADAYSWLVGALTYLLVRWLPLGMATATWAALAWAVSDGSHWVFGVITGLITLPVLLFSYMVLWIVSDEVQLRLLSRKRLTRLAAMLVARSSSPAMMEALLERPTLSERAIERAYQHAHKLSERAPEYYDEDDLFGDRLFEGFTYTHYVRIIKLVAQHPNVPVALLQELAVDDHICLLVARNPRTPVEVLADLARHKYPSVRQAVAGNPGAPPEIRVLAGLV